MSKITSVMVIRGLFGSPPFEAYPYASIGVNHLKFLPCQGHILPIRGILNRPVTLKGRSTGTTLEKKRDFIFKRRLSVFKRSPRSGHVSMENLVGLFGLSSCCGRRGRLVQPRWFSLQFHVESLKIDLGSAKNPSGRASRQPSLAKGRSFNQ